MDRKITVEYVRNLGETLGELISQAHLLTSFKTESSKHGAEIYAAVAMEKLLKMQIDHVHNHRLCASFMRLNDAGETGFLIQFIERCHRTDEPFKC